MGSKSLQRKVLLLVVDGTLIGVALLIAIRLVARPGYYQELVYDHTLYFGLPVIVFLLAVYFVQGYHLEEIVTPWRGLAAMFIAAVSGGVAVGFVFFLIPDAPEFSAKVLALSIGLIALFLWLARVVYGRLLSTGTLKENILLIGTGPSARRLVKELTERKRSPYFIVGLLEDPDVNKREDRIDNIPVYDLQELPKIMRRYRLDTVVLGMRYAVSERLVRLVTSLKRRGIKVTELTDLFEEVTGMTPVKYVGELKMLFQNYGRLSEFARLVEFVLNGGLATVILLISLPFWPFIIVAQQLSSRGPVFYRPRRVGKAGNEFAFYKFRSMIPDAESIGKGTITDTNDPRIFRVGKIIRKTHLDELPQLINIIKGDMNFIGPRAEMVANVEVLEKKIPYYHERHMIKPGLTGWAQVRNIYTDASEQGTLEKIQYDLYYLKNRSLALDLAIVLRTIKLIMRGKGTS